MPKEHQTVLRSGKTLPTANEPRTPQPEAPKTPPPSRIPAPKLRSANATAPMQNPDQTQASARQSRSTSPTQDDDDKQCEAQFTLPPAARRTVQATEEANIQRRQDQERAAQPYQYMADDPDPPYAKIGKKEYGDHIRNLREYSNGMFAAYGRTKFLREGQFWQDFVTAFRPHTIRSWTRPMLCEWKAMLLQRGISLDTDRNRDQYEVIIDVLYRTEYDKDAKVTSSLAKCSGEIIEKENKATQNNISQNGELRVSWNKTRDETYKTTGNQGSSSKRTTQPSGDPGDSDPSSDDDKLPKREKDPHRKHGNQARGEEKSTSICETEGRTSETRPLGVSGMMKAFVSMPTFSGKFTEDLEEVIQGFETIAEVCDVVDDTQKRKAIPIMLKGAAFRQYATKKAQFDTYSEAIEALREWFSSSEKQTRLLTEWNTMRLSESLEQDSDKSEIEVFKNFVDRATAIQQQLHASYHDDRQLRDMLLIAVDIPRIQEALRDRQPRTTHQLVERVATKLDHKRRQVTKAYIANENKTNDDALYTLGQKYGGAARRSQDRYSNWNRKGRPEKNRPTRNRNVRRPPPWWMRNVKGCFVCSSPDHYANQKHTREEVTKAIQRLKMRNPTALLTNKDKAYISQLFSDDSSSDESEADLANDLDEQSATNDDSDYGELAYIAKEGLEIIEQRLSNAALVHGISWPTEKRAATTEAYIVTSMSTGTFKGIRIDTCCNRTSIMGQKQYDEYCNTFGSMPSIKPCLGRGISGIGGGIRGIGLVLIDIPFTQLSLTISVQFLLVAEDIPTLLSMRDMKENGLDISLQNETIMHGGKSQKLIMNNFFLKHTWGPEDLAFALYTEPELRQIHRVFGHPSVGATQRLLRRAKGGQLDRETRRSIEQISSDCKLCERHKQAPRRFKLSVGMDHLKFNHNVQVDTMFIDGRPVCHMVDEATHFTAATFLRKQTTDEIWRAIQNMWCLVYLGPPDHLAVDQGTNYTSREMKGKCEAAGISLRQAPIETPGSIGVVERYHAPLRAAYTKIRDDCGREVTNEECLKMAVYAVNNTIGPEGLCPTILVFGSIPRPIRSTPSPSQLARAKAIDDAMDTVARVQAERRIKFGLRHIGGPKAKEDKTGLKELPSGAKVLVYRTKSDQWEGPHLFIGESGETAVVQTGAGRKIFRSVCVKPYAQPKEYAWHAKGSSPGQHEQSPENASSFAQTRKLEIEGLIKSGTFEKTDIADVPTGTRIFGSRFIDQLKVIGQRRKHKSRLVAQNYQDEGAAELGTKAPTIQRFSQRLLVSLAASLEGTDTCTRDVTQAYVQSKTRLERPVYLKPPAEMGLPPNIVLKVVRPLYGIPESGLHWYLTYLDHHVGRLGMQQSRVDPCFLMKHDTNGRLIGAAVLQVDDTLMVGTEEFLNDEAAAAKEFKSKTRATLGNKPLSFNGITLERNDEETILMRATEKIEGLRVARNEKEFASQRAAAQYIGVNCRPDTCANTQLIAPGNAATTKDEYKTLEKVVKHLKTTKQRGLRFAPIDIESTRLVVVSDASFANARDSKSQLGFVALMVDDKNAANIVHYSSARCRRVTRSVMAAELHALVLAFDFGFVIREMLRETLRRDVTLEALIDSKTVFEVVAKDAKTAERRLQIDAHAIRESYAKGELARIAWIPGDENPADALTKVTRLGSKKATSLDRLMMSNTFSVAPIGWARIDSSKKKNCASVDNDVIC